MDSKHFLITYLDISLKTRNEIPFFFIYDIYAFCVTKMNDRL